MKIIGLILVAVVIAVGVAFFPASGRAGDDTIVIVVNGSVKVSSLSVEEVKRIFLKQQTTWKGGGTIFPINAGKGTAVRKLFQSKVLKMDDKTEMDYWSGLKKKGLLPPLEFSNVQKTVFSVKGGIGYCLKSEYKPGTSRVVLTL